MQPTIEPTTPPAASPAAPAEQPAAPAPTFTAEQVAERERAAAQKAHDAAMAEARRIFEGKQRAASPPPAQQQSAPQPAAPAPTTTSALDIARVVQFTTEAAQHGIPAKGIELLASRLDAERPTDVRAWVAEQADAYGWRKPTTATSTPPSAAAPAPQAAPAGPPVTGNAAPSSAVRVTDDVPLINRTEADRNAYLEQHGLVAYTDRIRKEAAQNRVRFRLPRGG